MGRAIEPELEMARRMVPFALPAAALALVGGAAAGGWGVGWSAAIGIGIVFANLVASAMSLARAARHSLQALFAVAMIGFVVRLGIIVGIMFALNRFPFFSPLAFGLAVVPATLLVIAVEMKLVAGGVGRDLEIPPATGTRTGEQETAR